MIKSFGLVDNIWLDKTVKFPFNFAGSYIIHDFFKGKYPHKTKLHEWVKNQSEWGRYPVLVEIKEEYERKNHHSKYQSLKNMVSLVRLVQYNRVFLRHVVSFENKRITMSTSNDDFRPSSFLGKKEQLTKKDLNRTEKYIKLFRTIIEKKLNLRLPRAVLFWDSSSCSGNFERKSVEAFISLEALFTTDISEITYKLANRASWFLEKSDSKKRRELFDMFRKGYGIRSKIVHGRGFTKTKDISVIEDIHGLTRQIVLEILDNKKLFGLFTKNNTEALNNYYYDLTSGYIS